MLDWQAWWNSDHQGGAEGYGRGGDADVARARACVARVAHEQSKAAWMDGHTNTAPERWDLVTEGGGEWPMEKQERSCFLSLGRTNPTSEPTVLVNVPESVPSHQGTAVRWGFGWTKPVHVVGVLKLPGVKFLGRYENPKAVCDRLRWRNSRTRHGLWTVA